MLSCWRVFLLNILSDISCGPRKSLHIVSSIFNEVLTPSGLSVLTLPLAIASISSTFKWSGGFPICISLISGSHIGLLSMGLSRISSGLRRSGGFSICARISKGNCLRVFDRCMDSEYMSSGLRWPGARSCPHTFWPPASFSLYTFKLVGFHRFPTSGSKSTARWNPPDVKNRHKPLVYGQRFLTPTVFSPSFSKTVPAARCKQSWHPRFSLP